MEEVRVEEVRVEEVCVEEVRVEEVCVEEVCVEEVCVEEARETRRGAARCVRARYDGDELNRTDMHYTDATFALVGNFHTAALIVSTYKYVRNRHPSPSSTPS